VERVFGVLEVMDGLLNMELLSDNATTARGYGRQLSPLESVTHYFLHSVNLSNPNPGPNATALPTYLLDFSLFPSGQPLLREPLRSNDKLGLEGVASLAPDSNGVYALVVHAIGVVQRDPLLVDPVPASYAPVGSETLTALFILQVSFMWSCLVTAQTVLCKQHSASNGIGSLRSVWIRTSAMRRITVTLSPRWA